MGKLEAMLFFVPAGRVVVPMLWRVGACSGALLSDVGVVCELRECGLQFGLSDVVLGLVLLLLSW
jgi:hypothetical protein